MPSHGACGVHLHRLAPVARAAGGRRGQALRAVGRARDAPGRSPASRPWRPARRCRPGALASIRIATAGTAASAPTSTRLARAAGARRRAGGRRRGSRRRGRRRSASTSSSSSSAPKPWPASTRSAIGAPSAVSPSCANAQATSGTVATSTPPSATTRAQPQRHDREPAARAPIADREQRAARVATAAGSTSTSPSAGPGERVDRGVAGAARGEPQQRRDAERRGQADAVPVVERRAQARERLVGRERGREDLGQQRPAAERDGRDRDAAEQRAPAAGREPAEREPARERGEVGERAVGLEPRVARHQRPRDRERGEDGEQRERRQHPGAAQPRRRARRRAAATSASAHSAAPPSISATSVHVVRSSCEPPRGGERASATIASATPPASDRRRRPARAAVDAPGAAAAGRAAARRSSYVCRRATATASDQGHGRRPARGRGEQREHGDQRARAGRCGRRRPRAAPRRARPARPLICTGSPPSSRGLLDGLRRPAAWLGASTIGVAASGRGRRARRRRVRGRCRRRCRRRRSCRRRRRCRRRCRCRAVAWTRGLRRDRARRARRGSRSTRRCRSAARCAPRAARRRCSRPGARRRPAQSRRISIGSARRAPRGARSSAASRAMKMVRRIGEFTLAALSRRRAHATCPSAQASCVYAATASRAFAPSRARSAGSSCRRWIAAPQRVRVARRDDEPGALVLHEPAGGGSDGIGGDHGDSLVEGFVDDEPPRLEEVARGDRRYDHNVAARVEVAQIASGDCALRRDARACRTSGGPLAATSKPFSGAGRPANRTWKSPWRSGARRLRPERGVDRLRRLEHRAARVLGADVGADVRAVGGDRVRVAVDVAQREVGERVAGRARVAPDRRPQHERDAPARRRRRRRGARRARRARRPPRGSGRRRRAGRRRAAAGGSRGNGSSRARAAAAVAHVAADQREDDVLALVQRLERADAERRRVVGDEQDRSQRRGARRAPRPPRRA